MTACSRVPPSAQDVRKGAFMSAATLKASAPADEPYLAEKMKELQRHSVPSRSRGDERKTFMSKATEAGVGGKMRAWHERLRQGAQANAGSGTT